MTRVAFYRHRGTGKLHGADAIRRAAGRYTVNGRKAAMMLPKDPENWSDGTLARLGYDAVTATTPPQIDTARQFLDGRGAKRTEDGWEQVWTVRERHEDVESARREVLRRLHRIADEKRDRGLMITLDGMSMPVRTDLTGITRITGAKMGNRSSRSFVLGDDRTVVLSSTQINAIFDVVDDHVQGCFDRWSQLIETVKGADDPFSVDLKAGWPGDE